MMNRLLKNTIFQQLLFWSLSFLILYRLFSREGDNGLTDIYFTILFHLPLFLTVYGNYYLVKHFFIKKRRLSFYLFGIVGLVGLSIGFHYLTFNILADWIFPGYYFVSFYTIREILEFVGSYAIISTLLFLSKNWFTLKEKQLVLEKENHSVKLAALKSQINPHFLFNSLNNIYGITNRENQQSRQYILKLSDALRYMIYGTSEELVPLEKEITYLENYIALEKLRIDEIAAIQFKYDGDFSSYLIAPLVLLPLVENCFKHCDKNEPIINIYIKLENEVLTLESVNNMIVASNKIVGGLGVENLKKRLQLIYPNKYQLQYMVENGNYKNRLTIQLA